ncbi:MAG TPA: penicillin-binding transpeptidase domain-containing protein, partial [Candidatus Paceibacterota bacterium]|nr:penicillin-binding transpeptidase domain-containing protein [Candidatus Paceibacterota bacterium]
LPQYDTDQFEGKIERPIGHRSLLITLGLIMLVMGVYMIRAWNLQLINGTAYAKQAAENQLAEKVIFADRGIIKDRVGRELAYNNLLAISDDFPERTYAPYRGISHLVGYVKPPQKDTAGYYYRTSYVGIDGVERAFDGKLTGINGITLTETDAKGNVVSESSRLLPQAGDTITLSIDAALSEGLYDAIARRAEASKFQAGAGAIMDVVTGEIVALVSYPEYSNVALARGDEKTLADALANPRQPFLNRVISGLYAPGSIVKPIVAAAALAEGIIDEHKEILSTGQLVVPNPYFRDKPSIFKDWRAHGYVDMRRAIAVSSDVYFYHIGGGFGGQKGLGIDNIDKYLRIFGFGSPTGVKGFEEPAGTIPTPQWKEEVFDGDPWRVGDTYNTAIGQYGVQVTPLQALRATAALANGGVLLTPTLIASSSEIKIILNLPEHALKVAREGMRMSVVQGIAGAVNVPFVQVAAKTGTAQVGVRNEYINSWMIGFFPYERPRYAYAVVLERGPSGTLVGAPAAMNEFLWWMNTHTPHYFK